MTGTLRLALVASVLATVAAGSVQAASLSTTPLTPVDRAKVPTHACTFVQTSAGWYNPRTKVTIPSFG